MSTLGRVQRTPAEALEVIYVNVRDVGHKHTDTCCEDEDVPVEDCWVSEVFRALDVLKSHLRGEPQA